MIDLTSVVVQGVGRRINEGDRSRSLPEVIFKSVFPYVLLDAAAAVLAFGFPAIVTWMPSAASSVG
jgi:hypothetical protein